jgi:hypothetical protein
MGKERRKLRRLKLISSLLAGLRLRQWASSLLSYSNKLNTWTGRHWCSIEWICRIRFMDVFHEWRLDLEYKLKILVFDGTLHRSWFQSPKEDNWFSKNSLSSQGSINFGYYLIVIVSPKMMIFKGQDSARM